MRGSYQRIQREASWTFSSIDTPKGYKLADFLGWSLYDPNSKDNIIRSMSEEERKELRDREIEAIDKAFDF